VKLLRLTLRNWRGVEEREVRFAGTGVTVVEGPNETGKSSLVEAIDALFDHYDDTKKREILAVKPVHKDAGAEVEAEVETGPYRFVYSKRFHKKPETNLVVSQPAPENLTGREAHDRARRILEETVDMALWSALRIEQGQEVTQANLAEQRSLSAALTKSAGGAQVGETETTLYEAAKEEYLRYFTPTGVARRETAEAEAEVARLKDTLANDKADLARLETDIERSALLDREIVDARRIATTSAASEKEHDERLREIDRMSARVNAMKAQLDAALIAEGDAKLREAERHRLVEDARVAAELNTALAAGDDISGPALDEALQELDAAEAEFTRAASVTDDAERTFTIRQQDLEFRKDDIDLELLRERKQRIDAADAAAAQAEAVLAANAVTDGVLKTLHQAHVELAGARAALNAGSPQLRIRALADVTAMIDGRPRALAKGVEATVTVSGSLGLVLPGVAEIEVRTGTSTATLRDAFDRKNSTFVELCRAAGVGTLDEAVQANAAWQTARRDVEARDRILIADLRDLTREQIAQKIATLEPRVSGYPQSRPSAFPLPSDLDTAQEAWRISKAVLDTAKQTRGAAERRRDAARRRADQLRDERTHAQLSRERARTEAHMTAARLDQARTTASDDDIANRVETTRETLRLAERAHRTETERLVAEQPETARMLAENARAARRGADERLRVVENEQIEIRARLRERGEAGLAERADSTETKLDRACDAMARRRVHAAAGKLLFDTLDEERTSARRAYVAPLRTKIDELGRVVYGPTFGVELNETSLQIANRTLDDRTIPFESLSGGTKEQLGVISRLACALTVADVGGVPVLFDDTLGNTDPARAETMGALLALAGRRCQVIVLTCDPDRFRHIGGASIVNVG
jgi:AAA domain